MTTIRELKQKGRELKQRISTLAEDEGGRWVTMRGRKVFIREGETPTEAVSRQDRKWGTRIRRGKDMGSRPASSTPKLTGEEEHKKEWGLGRAGGIEKGSAVVNKQILTSDMIGKEFGNTLDGEDSWYYGGQGSNKATIAGNKIKEAGARLSKLGFKLDRQQGEGHQSWFRKTAGPRSYTAEVTWDKNTGRAGGTTYVNFSNVFNASK